MYSVFINQSILFVTYQYNRDYNAWSYILEIKFAFGSAQRLAGSHFGY